VIFARAGLWCRSHVPVVVMRAEGKSHLAVELGDIVEGISSPWLTFAGQGVLQGAHATRRGRSRSWRSRFSAMRSFVSASASLTQSVRTPLALRVRLSSSAVERTSSAGACSAFAVAALGG
jgi:hypothetical protein